MNRLVYLYELDSVRNTEAEIRLGQKALFHEIVKNGNKVVLSFNQLTDSDSFHNLLMDDKTYECVMTLFKNGAIKISRYGKYRTPSQFIQTAIDKCLEKNDDTFLFSGLPIKSNENELLQMIKDALQYNDVAVLEEYLEQRRAECYDEKSEGDELEQEEVEKDCLRIQFLIRYVKMLLLLSMEPLAINPPKTTPSQSFTDYMDKMLAVDYDVVMKLCRKEDNAFVDMVQQAIVLLNTIYTDFREKQVVGIQNRSRWIDEVETTGVNEDPDWKRRKDQNDKYSMAISMIELCYNYTIEDSIHNVSKRYNKSEENSFEKDYVEHLYEYWNQVLAAIHIPTTDEASSKRFVKVKIPWATAVRIVVTNNKESKDKEQLTEESPKELLYYSDFKKEKRKWNWKIAKNLFLYFFYTGVYIGLFCLVQMAMGKLEGWVSDVVVLQGVWYDLIIGTIVFGILGSIVSEKTQLPDILESFKNLGRGLLDVFYLIFATPFEKIKKWVDSRRTVCKND